MYAEWIKAHFALHALQWRLHVQVGRRSRQLCRETAPWARHTRRLPLHAETAFRHGGLDHPESSLSSNQE